MGGVGVNMPDSATATKPQSERTRPKQPEVDAQKTAINADLLDYAQLDADKVLAKLQTTVSGLSPAEAKNRLKQYGPNEVARKKPAPPWLQLLRTFNSPFNYLLLLLGTISQLTGNTPSAILIAIMVLLSVTLRFYQEYRSSKATEKLKAMVANRVSVYRGTGTSSASTAKDQPATIDIPLQELVPGDLISLSAGDLIPADVRLIEAKDLHINQSSLTGETFPVEKCAQPETQQAGQPAPDPMQATNLCFMGTSVVSGIGKAVVLATGDHTYFGNLAVEITAGEPPSSFEKGLNSLSWLLIRFILGMVVVILLINGLTKGNWWLSFIFALSVGVGMTPELLPMIVTTNLSRGAIQLSRKKVIVKRLASIQNLGAVDVLCMDKTGTLTQNKVILYKHLDLHGKENMQVLKYAYLNSHFESGLKNLLDEAILSHAEQEDSLKPDPDCHKIDEIPFDFERRRLSIVLEDQEQRLLICKGAVEEVLSVCGQIEDKGKHFPMGEPIREQVRTETKRMNQDGFRVIAIAYKPVDKQQTQWGVQDEQDLILLGYIAFLDPPKETTAKAIAELIQLGIEPKIVTGDSEFVTQKICSVVKLPVKGTLLGSEINELSDEELQKRAEACTIFARLNPGQKERIILALKSAGHVVGFLGDGINDSPALNAADIGLSVNNAVDIAKESADMILLEESLLVLNDGIIEGRKVFANIIKYIRMTTSSNFGNVFSMVGASFILPFLPMKPIQILTQNLLYDFSQLGIPFDRVDEETLQKPRRWEVKNVEHFLLTFGPVSSLFDYALFAVMWFVFQANTLERQEIFQTGWFIEGLLSQTLIVHLIRTAKIPFFQSWAAPQLITLTVSIMALGIYLPYSPIARFLGFVQPPSHYFWWLVGILISYCLLTQLVKVWFIKRFSYK